MNHPSHSTFLRYRVPFLMLFFVTVMMVYVIRDFTQNLESFSDYIFAAWMSFGIIPVIHFWSHYFFLGQYVGISEEGLEFKTNFLIPWKKEFLRFQDIKFIRCVTSNGQINAYSRR